MHVHSPNTKKFALPEAFARQWMNCVARFNPKRGLRSAVTPGTSGVAHHQMRKQVTKRLTWVQLGISGWSGSCVRSCRYLWPELSSPALKILEQSACLRLKIWIAVFFFFYIIGSCTFLLWLCCVAYCVCVCARLIMMNKQTGLLPLMKKGRKQEEQGLPVFILVWEVCVSCGLCFPFAFVCL